MHVKRISYYLSGVSVREALSLVYIVCYCYFSRCCCCFELFFCNYKGNTPTINIETVHKLNTRTDKKAKQTVRATTENDSNNSERRRQRWQPRDKSNCRGCPIGNNNVNKPEIQISINFPSLRTHARTHAGAHTRTRIQTYRYLHT